MIALRSAWRGIVAMKRGRGAVNYGLDVGHYGRCWCHVWTPIWHEGRGPYVSIGLRRVRFLRGY